MSLTLLTWAWGLGLPGVTFGGYIGDAGKERGNHFFGLRV